jgi:release factor glutamine methyltransferase
MSEATGKADVAALDIRAALKEGMARLRAAKVPSHTLATELLLMHALGRDRTWIYTHPEELLDPALAQHYFSLVARRAAGEPTQYIIGKQEFWGLSFEVTPAVLIPRPETEHVLEVVLERLGARGIKIRLDTGAPSEPLRVADMGTGSGCLAVALAYELPHADVFATDISEAALEIGRRNAARHGVAGRIHFVRCNLLDAFRAAAAAGPAKAGARQENLFDLIVSNPPYVGTEEAAALPREVREHEPHTALFGGASGVEIYARLIEQAGLLLCAGGILVLELGYNAADHVLGLLREQPCWANISVTNDLAGIPRVIAAELIGTGSAASGEGHGHGGREGLR